MGQGPSARAHWPVPADHPLRIANVFTNLAWDIPLLWRFAVKIFVLLDPNVAFQRNRIIEEVNLRQREYIHRIISNKNYAIFFLI